MIEQDDLKLFYRVFVETLFSPESLASETNPVRVMERAEKTNPALFRRGLRISISDAMSMIRLEHPDRVAVLSQRLAAAGAPSIEMVRAYLSKKWSAIVKRGTIETDEQFYLVRELVDAPDLAEMERLKLTEILDAYEISCQGKVRPSKP